MAEERNTGEGGKIEGKQKEGRVFAQIRPAKTCNVWLCWAPFDSVSHLSTSLLDQCSLHILILRGLCSERMKHSAHVTCTQTATLNTVMCFSLVPTK